MSSELENAIHDVTDIVSCLSRITETIKHPVSIDRIRQCASISIDPSADREHTDREFPNAPEFLRIRLAEANTKRRQLLIYYKQQHLNPMASNIHPEGYVVEGQATNDDEANSCAGMPSLPEPPIDLDGDGKFFECPYCYDTISVKNQAQWK